MAGRLDDPFQGGIGGPGGWHFAIEPELHLGPDVLVPDLAGWRRERMPTYPDDGRHRSRPRLGLRDPLPRHPPLRPDREARPLRPNAVAHLWLVDPDARTLEAFALTAGAWTLAAAFQDGDDIRAAPFEALTFPLGALWPD